MLLRSLMFAPLAIACLLTAGCSSLSGSTRDAFAPLVELSQPETVDNVIIGGTNPYSNAVNHSLTDPGSSSLPVGQTQVMGVFASSQTQAQQMIAEAVMAQCGSAGQMSAVVFANGQWLSTVQCSGAVLQ